MPVDKGRLTQIIAEDIVANSQADAALVKAALASTPPPQMGDLVDHIIGGQEQLVGQWVIERVKAVRRQRALDQADGVLQDGTKTLDDLLDELSDI